MIRYEVEGVQYIYIIRSGRIFVFHSLMRGECIK